MNQTSIPEESGNSVQEVFRIGFTDEGRSSAIWEHTNLADLPSGFAQEVIANLKCFISGPIEELLAELRRISVHRLTLFIPEFDAEESHDGRYGRLSDFIGLSASCGLVLRDLRISSNGEKGTWLYFVCSDESPYNSERLSLLQSATTTIYEHVARYGFLMHLVKDKRILDVGCGAGLGAAFLSQFASEVVAIDLSHEAIADAKKLRPRPNVYYEQMNALDADADLGQFDVVICLEVIEHFSSEDQQRLVHKMSHWLAEGGLVVCSTPNPAYDPPNPFHQAPLDADALDMLFASAFPYRITCVNAVALGGIVIPTETDFESEVHFFDWDEQGNSIISYSKEEQRKTHFILLGSTQECPKIKCSISLDVKNDLLRSFHLVRSKEKQFRSEEGVLFRSRLQKKQEMLAEIQKSFKNNSDEINNLERHLVDYQRQLFNYENLLSEQKWVSEKQQESIVQKEQINANLKNQLIEKQNIVNQQNSIIHQKEDLNQQLNKRIREAQKLIDQQRETIIQQNHDRSNLNQEFREKQSLIEQLQETIIATQTHGSHLEAGLAKSRQHSLNLRAALIRKERERLHLKEQLEEQSETSGGKLITHTRNLHQLVTGAFNAAFAPVAVANVPAPPQENDREPETVAFWQYTYQRFAALHEELIANIQQLEGAPYMNRLRGIVRRLRSLAGHTIPPEDTGLPSSILMQPCIEALEANDPQVLYQHVRRLHAQSTVLAQRLEHRSARFYRGLYPAWEQVKQTKKHYTPSRKPHGAKRTSKDGAYRRLVAKPVVPAARMLSKDACPALITIVTPTYNRKELLTKAVSSALGQSYVNWELIVVDDGSTDGTSQLQDDYRDARICWVTQPRGGVCKARNTALQLARGDYVAFLDSDNVWHPEYLEKMYEALSSAPADAVAVYCNLNLFYDDQFVQVMDEHYEPSTMFHRPQIDLNAFIVQRQALDRVGGFDKRMNKWVDYELMLRLSQQGRFLHVDETLVDYFRLADGITRAKETERPMEPNLEVIRETRRSQLRVGYVQWDYPAASQAFAHREAEALRSKGIDVRVYYKEDAEPAASPAPNVPSYQVKDPDELAQLAQAHGIHLLHGYFAYPHTTALLWPAAEKAGIFFSFSGHGVDIFHHQNERRSHIQEMANSPLCKSVFVPGNFHKQYFLDRGAPLAKIHVNRYLIDESWLHLAGGDLQRPIRRVIQIGRFIDKKDPLLFLEVARACQTQDIEFELYGYGPLEIDVLKAAEGLHNTKVQIGAVSNHRIREIMDQADAFLLPCRRAPNGDMDGLPVVLIEAACRGLLLISSNVSSIPDLVEDGVTGLVAEAGDVKGFTAAVHKAFHLPPNERRQLRTQALDRIRTEYTSEVVTESLITHWCK